MLIKKRQVLTATLVIGLCAALTVNWYFTKPQSTTEETTRVEDSVTGNLGDTLFVAGTTAVAADEENTEETTETQLVNNEVKIDGETAEADEYFSSAKLKRTKSYDEVIANVEKILSDEKAEIIGIDKVFENIADSFTIKSLNGEGLYAIIGLYSNCLGILTEKY